MQRALDIKVSVYFVEVAGGDEEVDESSAQEIFEEKLKDAIDGILEKR